MRYLIQFSVLYSEALLFISSSCQQVPQGQERQGTFLLKSPPHPAVALAMPVVCIPQDSKFFFFNQKATCPLDSSVDAEATSSRSPGVGSPPLSCQFHHQL